MAFRRTQKITKDCKLTFEVYFDSLVGFPTDPYKSDDGAVSEGAPEFYVEFERGGNVTGKSAPQCAVVDAARANDLLPYGLGDCAPTVTKIDHLIKFNATLQRKNDFNYKPKQLTLRVVDSAFGTGVIGGDIDLAKSVDREMFTERTFEMMNPSKNKCLVVTIQGYPTPSKAEGKKAAKDREKSEKAAAPEKEDETEAAAVAAGNDRAASGNPRTGSPRTGSPRHESNADAAAGGGGSKSPRGGGSPRSGRGRRAAAKADDDDEDEFGDLVESGVAKKSGDPASATTSPRGRGRPASPSPNPTPPPAEREKKQKPPAGSLLAAPPANKSNNKNKKGEERKEKSAGEEDEAAAPAASGRGGTQGTQQRSESGDAANKNKKGEKQAIAPVALKRKEKSAGEEDEAAAPVASAAAPAVDNQSSQQSGGAAPSSSDDEQLETSTKKTKERGDHSMRRPIMYTHNSRGEATRTPTPPLEDDQEDAHRSSTSQQQEGGAAASDDDIPESQPLPLSIQRELEQQERDANKSSQRQPANRGAAAQGSDSDEDGGGRMDGAAMGLQPVTAADREIRPKKSNTAAGGDDKRSSLRPVTAPSSHMQQSAAEDKAARLVTRWIKDIRSSALLEVDDSSVKHSKRQSLSTEERSAPLPPASQMILEALHVSRVPNGELAFFVGDFVGQLLYTEVVANTRHYGMWVRILLHVIEELLIYYFPSQNEMPEGALLDEIQGEQEFFTRMMQGLIQTKDDKFTDAQQSAGVHVDHILDEAMNRGHMNHNPRHSRWEIEESNEDREDRVYLHAFVVIECGCVLEQLSHLASDRVMGLLEKPVENFTFNSKRRLMPPSGAAGAGDAALEDAGKAGTTNFIFAVTQQRSRYIVGGGNSGQTMGPGGVIKPQMFTTELGASGWLPSLIQELDALFMSLASPKAIGIGSTAEVAIKSRSEMSKKATLRTRTMLVEVFRPIFFNIQSTLVNLMHHRRHFEPKPAADAGAGNRQKNKKVNKKQEEEADPCCEDMQLRTAKDAMNLKLTVSALEQWLIDHNLYSEIRKHLLLLRQICDLFILSKAIFVNPKTRMDVCGLVSEELMFHCLVGFKTDDREIMPDSVPPQLLDSLASSIALRHGLPQRSQGQPAEVFVAKVASEVPIPINQLIPVDFALNHIDGLMDRQKKRAGEDMEEGTDNAAIRDSLEWDAR